MTETAIRRPNGKLYKPRKARTAVTFENRYGYTGVAVLRTHDIPAARQAFAGLLGDHELWDAEGRQDWWREVPWDAGSGHDWSWITDELRGVPCVVFDVE